MRKVLNTNELPFSVLLASGGLHALYPNKPEVVDLAEEMVEEYRTKGFEIGDKIEEPKDSVEPVKEAEPAKAPVEPVKETEPAKAPVEPKKA